METNHHDTEARRTRKVRFAVFRGGFWLILCASVSLWFFPVGAQDIIPGLVVTTGTTIRDAAGQDWAYLFWDAIDPAVAAGKRFAVFAKAGDPTAVGTFAQKAVIGAGIDPGTFAGLLQKSVSLGENLGQLDSTASGFLRRTPGADAKPLAEKIGLLINAAATDPLAAQSLGLLLRVHPGVALCAGQAFAEIIPGTTTYELRELDVLTAKPSRVVGRITIVPGSPVILPAPGKPFQIVTNAASDHLTIRLRWGTPDDLRRLSLLSYGFSVYRISRSDAQAKGFVAAPPTRAQLLSTPEIQRINEAPVLPQREFTAGPGPGAADDPSDRTTFFISDNNQRLNRGSPPFADGDEFYYFITARDLLGRDGEASVGGLARACARTPPNAPPSLRVENYYEAHAGVGGGNPTTSQRLELH